MSSRANTGNFYVRTKPFKGGLKPLHYTFYLSTGMNREQRREEQRRPSALKARKNGTIRRITRFTATFNKVKRAIKQYTLRQYRGFAVQHFIRFLGGV